MDDDGPDEGDDKDDEKKKPAPKRGNLIVLPGGRTVSPSEDLGIDYVASQTAGSSDVPGVGIIDPVAIDAEVRERDRFVQDQKLVDVVRRKGQTSEIIETALLEIAEELAHIKYERRKAAKDGKNTANYSMGRISGLHNLANLLLKRQEAARGERLDLKSPRLQAIFKIWMEFFYESMEKSGVESQIIDLVFQQMKADMIGWEKRMDGAGED